MSSLLTDADGNRDGDEASRERRLRYRVLLAEYRTVLALAFVVLLVLGGWLSYGAYAEPDERQERRLESEWTATGSFAHGSVVTEPNEIHPEGDRLEGEPLYYESIAPTVETEFTGGYDAARATDVAVELRIDLVYRAVDPDDGTVYWSRRESLASVAESDVGPNETVTATAAVNVTEVRNAIAAIEEDLEASPGETEIVLDLERTVDGTIEGDERSATDGYEVPIRTDGNTYSLDANDSYDETREEYTTETVTASPGPLRSLGGPALLALGLLGLGGVGVAVRRWPAPTADERAWLDYRDDRAEFDEVITTARLPESALEGPRAEVESLAALARLGIDLGSAVLFDPERERYVVRDGDLRYVFEPPRLPAGDDVLAPVGDASESAVTVGEATTSEGATEGRATGTTTDALEPTETDAPPAAETAEAAEPATEPTEPRADVDDSPTGSESVVEYGESAEPAAASTTERADDPATDSTDDSATEPADDPVTESTADPATETAARNPQATPESESPPVADRTAEIDDDDLLALAGLEPADISEPELFDLDGGREGTSASTSSGGGGDDEAVRESGARNDGPGADEAVDGNGDERP